MPRKLITTLPELAERLKARSIETKAGCHEWQGAKDVGGYGVIRFNGRNVRAHRASLAHHLNRPDLIDKVDMKPPRIAATYVLHTCDNAKCINPEHLRLGTPQDNADDATSRKRRPDFISTLPRKLDEASVREIRIVAKDWDGLCDMMKKHRVGQMAINDVLSRKTYKWVG
jgi:hypothetical protein